MNSVIKKLIGEITELAFEITNKSKHKVFVKYYGTVNCFEISYHQNGKFNGSDEIAVLDIYMNHEKNIISKLKQAKRKLKKLLEEK